MDSCYEVFNLIGEGSFGKVYKARCRQTNQLVAYKIISKNGRKPSEVYALREECKIQKHLEHRNIIRMLHSFETENELVVVTEFAQKDLCRILKQEGVFPEVKAKKILRDLVAALHYLHSNRVLHRDLKPQNVLLDANGTAKLCDFGFAKSLGNDLKVLTSIKGTPLYMAPELMNESPYDHNADLWSLGCIAYELVTGHTPYTTTSMLQLIQMVKLKPIDWPNYLSEICLSFLKGLLQKNPQERLSWPYLLHHPFLSFVFMPSVQEYKPNHQYPLPVTAYNFVPIQSPLANAFYDQSIRMIPQQQSPNNLNLYNRNIACDKSIEEIDSKTDESIDAAFLAQKEEWLEFLKKTIGDVMYAGDVDVLIQKPSLMLIINAFNSCKKCPTVVITVARLLSLPFVVEHISESQLSSVKQNYSYCAIMKDLVIVVKQIVLEINTKNYETYDSSRESALQHLLLLICNLTYVDQSFLKQFFTISVSSNVFKLIKNILNIRTKTEPLSVVKYFISIFLRLYILIPQSRPIIVTAFQNCVPEFHSLLREDSDLAVHVRLCIFITVLGCTQPNFLNKANGFDSLIKDLTQLKLNYKIPSVQQVTDGTLEVLKNATLHR